MRFHRHMPCIIGSVLVVLMLAFPLSFMGEAKMSDGKQLNNLPQTIGVENNWTQRYPEVHPSMRVAAGMAFHTMANKTILFGGLYPMGVYEYDDTWEYDYLRNNWTQRFPTNHPSVRSYSVMQYLPSVNRIILFGGANGIVGVLSDTWEYNYATNNWTQRYPTSHPTAREFAGSSYDESEGKLILFGGFDGSWQYYADTWEYNYATNNWTQKYPTTHPSGRMLHGMTYNTSAGLTTLFGGYTDGGINRETWVYSHATNNWTKMFPSANPTGRYGLLMAYDSNSNRCIIYGGIDTTFLTQHDTWQYNYDTNNWTNLNPPMHPGNRQFMSSAIVYDVIVNGLLVFGGYDGLMTYYDDTWVYPLNRYDVGFATDPPGMGNITFDGVEYGNGMTELFTGGIYTLSATPPEGYALNDWETTGGVSVIDGESMVLRAGTLQANFVLNAPTEFNVTFIIEHGYITFYGEKYEDGDVVTVIAGFYSVTAHPSEGYLFDRWLTTGDVFIVSNVANVVGECTIEAVLTESTPTPEATETPNQTDISVFIIIVLVLIALFVLVVRR